MSLPATFGDARDEILTLLKDAWAANAPAANGGTAPVVYWPGLSAPESPSPAAPHMKVFLRHISADQVSLGHVGARRFKKTGLVTMQIFTPQSDKLGLSLAENLATIANNAYEGVGTDSGIWFRKTRIIEVGPDNGYYQMNVLSEFQYDQIK